MPSVGISYIQDLEDLRRAIDAIGGDADEASRMRTCLRLQLAGARPGEVAKVRADDSDLSGSAILRAVPNLKVTVWVQRTRERPLMVVFEGVEAQDAKRALLASATSEGAVFTPQCVRNAREALSARLGRAVRASDYRRMTMMAAWEKSIPWRTVSDIIRFKDDGASSTVPPVGRARRRCAVRNARRGRKQGE